MENPGLGGPSVGSQVAGVDIVRLTGSRVTHGTNHLGMSVKELLEWVPGSGKTHLNHV